jgi:hypothetical protein
MNAACGASDLRRFLRSIRGTIRARARCCFSAGGAAEKKSGLPVEILPGDQYYYRGCAMESTAFNYQRHGPDRVLKTITLFIMASWVMCIVIFAIVAIEKAPIAADTYRDLGMFVSGESEPGLMDAAVFLMGAQFLMGIMGLGFQARRMRRTTDQYSIVLFLFTLASLAGLMFYSRLF